MGELTKNFAYRTLSKLGVNQNIKTGWRYLRTCFGGIGLIDLATESVISRLNLFLQHWDNPEPIGETLRCSMQFLQMEIGCAGNPLLEPFSFMGPHCTHSWVRSFWECVDKYNLQVMLDYPTIPFPRENDLTIMSIARSLGITGEFLESINRCRLWCCVIFLSDVADAAGKGLDPTRGQQGVYYGDSSTYDFPRTQPSAKDWEAWRDFWRNYCLPDGTFPRALGKWKHNSHRRWEWFYDPTKDCLHRLAGDRVWEYKTVSPSARTRGSLVYTCSESLLPDQFNPGQPVSVELLDDTTVRKLPVGPNLVRNQRASSDSSLRHSEVSGCGRTFISPMASTRL